MAHGYSNYFPAYTTRTQPFGAWYDDIGAALGDVMRGITPALNARIGGSALPNQPIYTTSADGRLQTSTAALTAQNIGTNPNTIPLLIGAGILALVLVMRKR